MSGENSGLSDLQREAEKQRAALRASEEKIRLIEEAERKQREEAERKQRELASLQQKLKTCQETISWIEKKILECKELSQGQVDIVSQGKMEAIFPLKASLQELAAWKLELAAFKDFAASLPEKIKQVGG